MTEAVCTRCWQKHDGIICEVGEPWAQDARREVKPSVLHPEPLSDRDRLLAILDSFGLQPTDSTFWHTISLEAKTPKVDGYTGSQVDFEFDKEGKFKSIYIYGAG